LFISILITRPLGGLKSATQKFSGGNLQSRAPVKITRRNDAFGELAREFNQMGSRIESLIAEHQRLLRDVSHELRSPLSRMQVAATLLEDKVGEDSASQAQVARIQSEILRLDTLIGQLLSLARLQAGSTVLDMEEVSLKNLLRKVAQDATYEFSEKGKNVDVHGDEAIIQADADTLRSTFENVIRNGLRYTRSTLQVSLGSLLPNTARIEIVDDGPGVPDEELESIFEPFYRPDQSRSETTGSTGLGLAIAKGIVEAHGGEISAANATNGGLVVTIDLPAA
jgi:signal transduction histidine kinase